MPACVALLGSRSCARPAQPPPSASSTAAACLSGTASASGCSDASVHAAGHGRSRESTQSNADGWIASTSIAAKHARTHSLRGCLVACIKADQAPRMQHSLVWLPVLASEPGCPDAKSTAELGSGETRESVVPGDAGSRHAGIS